MAAYTTIDDPEAYFQVKIYTGGGGTQAITLDGDTDMQPDLVWIKDRDDTFAHQVHDSVRGASAGYLSTDSAGTEQSTYPISSFDSDGWTTKSGGTDGQNVSGDAFVSWNWKESAIAGFDINIHTGSGSSADISHNLSAVPELIFTKRRNDTQQWFTFTTVTGAQKALFLDTNSAISTQASAYDALPTSSVTNYGNDVAVNGSDDTYVAYLWRSVQGFSKFGSYTGNGNADGPFVHTGFRPAFVMQKQVTDADTPWMIFDNKRDTFNETGQLLYPDVTNAEADDANPIDILSNGFKLRTSGSYNNGSGKVIFYAAFAEAPFVNSNGVPCNAR